MMTKEGEDAAGGRVGSRSNVAKVKSLDSWWSSRSARAELSRMEGSWS